MIHYAGTTSLQVVRKTEFIKEVPFTIWISSGSGSMFNLNLNSADHRKGVSDDNPAVK